MVAANLVEMMMRFFDKRMEIAGAALILAIGNLTLPADLTGGMAAFAQGSGQGSGQGGSHGGSSSGHGQSGKGGQGGASAHGTPARGLSGHVFETDEGPSEDSKGPQYGGGRASTGKPGTAGTKKGDLLGDMWIILRDANGVPILNSAGFVQPIDKDGNLIPLDAEGAPLDLTLVQEVEIGRTNVARSPTKVLDKSLSEAITSINAATSVSLDQSGRLVLTTDGVAKTIDSPLENLAIYKTLMATGTLPGITDPSKLASLSYLVDGQKTVADYTAAAGFLAGATDKDQPLSVDEVVYLNQILGIPGTITGADGKTYVDYTGLAYDRQAVYGDMTAQVLIETSPGTYVTQTVNVYDKVFSGTELTATAAAAFSDAADDARAVLLYLHDNAPR